MEYLVIDRNRWARAGANKGGSKLLNSLGNKCCLGFYCTNKISFSLLNNYAPPFEFTKEILKKENLTTKEYYEFWDNFIIPNDSYGISNKERERILTQKFLELLNVEVTFIN